MTKIKERLHNLIAEVENDDLRKILEKYAKKEKYLKSEASFSHHVNAGGLLEHSIEVAEIALVIADYLDKDKETLNRDYLIFGGLLHDLGKAYMEVGEYQMSGFVAHVSVGAHELYNDLKKTSLDNGVIEQIMNLVLAHHSKFMKNVPLNVDFLTLEAYIISIADSLSAIGTQSIKQLRDHGKAKMYAQDKMEIAKLISSIK